jgi:hypothetical protein
VGEPLVKRFCHDAKSAMQAVAMPWQAARYSVFFFSLFLEVLST